MLIASKKDGRSARFLLCNNVPKDEKEEVLALVAIRDKHLRW